MIGKMREIEVKSGATPLLETLREELEGISGNPKAIVAKKASASSRIKRIRNSHVAQCGNIFFKRNFFGFIRSNPGAGGRLISKLFSTR